MSKPIKNIREGLVSQHLANQDLARLLQVQVTLNHVPVKMTEQEFKFLMLEWPCATESEQIKFWRNCVDVRAEEVEKYLVEVGAWIKHEEWRVKTGVRCTIPKKKQRELGMLPSVENEIAMREGRV